MKYTIEDLRNGKCAVRNDGMLGELRKVLSLAFPLDGSFIEGLNKYYFASGYKGTWAGCSEYYNNLPSQSVKDFLNIEEEFKWGDEVEGLFLGKWIKVKYIGKCINDSNRSVVFSLKHHVYLSLLIRPTKTELTREQIAEKFGIDVDKLIIKD